VGFTEEVIQPNQQRPALSARNEEYSCSFFTQNSLELKWVRFVMSICEVNLSRNSFL
jgi:hypothetical protein